MDLCLLAVPPQEPARLLCALQSYMATVSAPPGFPVWTWVGSLLSSVASPVGDFSDRFHSVSSQLSSLCGVHDSFLPGGGGHSTCESLTSPLLFRRQPVSWIPCTLPALNPALYEAREHYQHGSRAQQMCWPVYGMGPHSYPEQTMFLKDQGPWSPTWLPTWLLMSVQPPLFPDTFVWLLFCWNLTQAA